MGIERLILLVEEVNKQALSAVPETDIYVLYDDVAASAAMIMAEQIRETLPHFSVQYHCGGGSFKSQFKKADRSGAEIALIIGGNELETDEVSIKYLRQEIEQRTVSRAQLFENLRSGFVF